MLRVSLVSVLTLGLCVLCVQGNTAEIIVEGHLIPLPAGTPLSDEELLEVEGDLGFFLSLLILTAIGATAGAGGKMIEEQWFDEDYGIDGDDWRQIGSGAIQGAIGGFAGGLGARFIPI